MDGYRFGVVTSAPLQFSFQNVREQSGVMWKDLYCGKTLRFGIGFFFVEIGLLIWQFRRLPPQVPLFYSRPWGELQLAAPWWLFFLPGLSLLLLLINALLGGVVFQRDKLLARMLLTAATLTQFLTLFALLRIFWLVL